MENPEDYNLTPEQQEFETSMHLKIMETYGMGKPVQAAVVIASTGGMLVLLRNRGLAVKVIVSPMIGFTAGTAVNAACFMVSLIKLKLMVKKNLMLTEDMVNFCYFQMP